MNTLISTSFKLQSFHTFTTKTHFPKSILSLPHKKLKPFSHISSNAQKPLAEHANESTYTAFEFEDVIEKDWAFLEPQEDSNLHEKFDRIISAGEIEHAKPNKVVVSLGCEAFVDRLVELKSDCLKLLLVVHDALLVLACVKEKHDDLVKCWQGELVFVPEKWAPLDVVFLYFLPGLPFELDGIFGSLAKRCSSGARVVISHPQGRSVLEQQKKQHTDIVVSDLPEMVALEKVAEEHSFRLTEFVDEPDFYLAVLKFSA